MTSSLHIDLTPYLTAQGLGVFGTDYKWGQMPDEPSDLLTFYETPGPSGTYAKDGAAATEGRLQALSRAETYAVAMQKAWQAYGILDGMRVTINGTRYSSRALQRPFDLGAQDDSGRTTISTNFAIFIRPT